MRIIAIVVLLASVWAVGLAAPSAAAADCSFTLGFKALHDMIPSIVGDCKVNEHHNPDNGDGLQETTGGLLVWRKADNWTAFTDGYHTWINGPEGLQERLNTDRFPWEQGSTGPTWQIVATWQVPQGRRVSVAPSSVAAAPDGTFYIVDGSGRQVDKISARGEVLKSWGGPGSGPGQFIEPYGIAVDSANNVYVGDDASGRIQVFSPDGQWITQWGISPDGTIPDTSRVDLEHRGQAYPSAMTVDSNRNVLMTNAFSRPALLQKFSPNGRLLWQKNPPDNPNEQKFGQYWESQGVAVDASGNVYITDETNDRVLKFSPDGSFLSSWGTLGSGPGQFNFPEGIALDGDGNVYVADNFNNRIQELSANGQPLGQWGTGGHGGPGQLSHPTQISIDRDGNLLVLDWGNERIQKLQIAHSR
jgi:streptogramin lyase